MNALMMSQNAVDKAETVATSAAKAFKAVSDELQSASVLMRAGYDLWLKNK